MPIEIIVGMLCIVAIFLVGWTILLRVKIEELVKKQKALEHFYQTHTKLDNL